MTDPRDLLEDQETDELEETGLEVGLEEDLGDEGDDLGLEGEEQPKPKATPQPMVLEGEGVPEELQGRSVQEVVSIIRELQTAGQMAYNQLQQIQAQAIHEDAAAGVPEFSAEDFTGADPQEFAQKLDQFFQAKATPYVQNMQVLQARNNYSQAMEVWPHLKDYKAEVDRLVARMPTNQLANPSIWNNINAHIVQNHMDEISERRKTAASRRRPRVEETPGGSTRPEGPGGSSTRLNRAERYVAQQLGIKPEEYARSKKETVR